jgi:hypothetical protein
MMGVIIGRWDWKMSFVHVDVDVDRETICSA